MKRINGFTMIETVITLMIVVSLLMIGTIRVNEYRSSLIFNSSVDKFKSALEQASRVAVIKQEKIELNYFTHSHYLEMIGNNYYRKIIFEKDFIIYDLNEYYISNNGMIKPKRVFLTDGRHKKILRVQMAWGKILDEKD